MPDLKFKSVVIRCYKIELFLLPRALATKRLLFCPITYSASKKCFSVLCPPCFGLVAWPDVIKNMTKYYRSVSYLFKMATVGVQAKTLPLLRQSFAIWQAKRYLNVF